MENNILEEIVSKLDEINRKIEKIIKRNKNGEKLSDTPNP